MNSKSRQLSNTPNRLSVSNRAELRKKIGTREGEMVYQTDINTTYSWFNSGVIDNNGTQIGTGAGWVHKPSARVSVKVFGAVGDGVTDDTVAIQDCLNTQSSIYVPKGVFIVSKALYQQSYSKIVSDGTFKASGILVGHEGVFYYDTVVECTAVGLKIDCGDFPANSGVIIRNNTTDIRLYDTEVRNASWDSSRGGGRGVIVEGNTGAANNTLVDGLRCDNVDTVMGVNGYTGSRKNNIIFSNITATNARVLIGLWGNGTGYPHTADSQSCIISNVTAHNITMPVMSDRGGNAIISGVFIYNNAAVPKLDSVVRGYMNNVKISDFTIESPKLSSIFNASPWSDNGSIVDLSLNIENCDIEIKHIGVTDDVFVNSYTRDNVINCNLKIDSDQVVSNKIGNLQFAANTKSHVSVYNKEHNARISGKPSEIKTATFSINSNLDFISKMKIGDSIFENKRISPVINNSSSLGEHSHRYKDIFAFNGFDCLAPNGKRYKIGVDTSGNVIATFIT